MGWKMKIGEERLQKASGRNEIVYNLRSEDLNPSPTRSDASCRDFVLKGPVQTESGHSLSMVNGQLPTPCSHLPVSIRLMAMSRFADTVKSSYMVPRNPVAI